MITTHTSLRLLLIENAADFIYLFERYAQLGQWELVVARNSQEAAQFAQETCPDIVFINARIQVPGGGWPILRTLKADPDFQNIPVAVYSSLPDAERARQEGVDFSLCKPVFYDDVKNIVDGLDNFQPRRKIQGGVKRTEANFISPNQAIK